MIKFPSSKSRKIKYLELMPVLLYFSEEEGTDYTTTTFAAESLSPRHFVDTHGVDNFLPPTTNYHDSHLEPVPEAPSSEEDKDEEPAAQQRERRGGNPQRLGLSSDNAEGENSLQAPLLVPPTSSILKQRTSSSGFYPEVPSLSNHDDSGMQPKAQNSRNPDLLEDQGQPRRHQQPPPQVDTSVTGAASVAGARAKPGKQRMR